MSDRLSNLPSGILHEILTRLPFNEQVRTSILSTQWRHLWSTNPVLSLDHFNLHRGFIPMVDHCLLLCSRIEKLQSLFLPVKGTALASVLPRWLRFAADRFVAELVLRGCRFTYGGYRTRIPPALFDCQHLAILKIDSCSFPYVPSNATRHRLHSLKTLVLYRVNVSSDALRGLLSLCSSIEHLTLSLCDQVTRVAIVAPTMKSLAVQECNRVHLFEIISAPRLRTLVYSGDFLKIRSLEGAPDIEEPTLLSSSRAPFGDRRLWHKFLSSIPHVMNLTVNGWLFEFSLEDDYDFGSWRPVFENLKELHWLPVYNYKGGPRGFTWTCKLFNAASLRELISTLRYCPSLELLCVHRDFYREETLEEKIKMHWWHMKAMRDRLGFSFYDNAFQYDYSLTDPLAEYEGVGYLLPQLKMLKVIEFAGEREETRMVEFLLDKAVALESLLIYCKLKRAEELNRVDAQISAMPKASLLLRTSVSKLPKRPCPKEDASLCFRCMDP